MFTPLLMGRRLSSVRYMGQNRQLNFRFLSPRRGLNPFVFIYYSSWFSLTHIIDFQEAQRESKFTCCVSKNPNLCFLTARWRKHVFAVNSREGALFFCLASLPGMMFVQLVDYLAAYSFLHRQQYREQVYEYFIDLLEQEFIFSF